MHCRLTTVFLSATSEHCPSFTFYVLEVIVNTAMIVEVSIRFFAFGKVSHTTLPLLSPASTSLTSARCFRVAILGFLLQHPRPPDHPPLCRYPRRDLFQRLFSQERRSVRYVLVGREELVPVWEVGTRPEKVSHTPFVRSSCCGGREHTDSG